MRIDAQAQQFFAALHQGGLYGYWWTVEGRQSFWWEVGKSTPLPGGRRNVYFGVHPTTVIPETDAHGEIKESRAVRGQVAIIAAINCLFAEYDLKDYPDQAALNAKIESLNPSPSACIASGGGFHCYWLLAVPWSLCTPEDREQARKLQGAWVRLMDGDPQSKDLARVLRVPGTTNHKYTPPRPVSFVWCDLTTRYAVDELTALAQPFLESDRPDQTTRANTTGMDAYLRSALAGEIIKVASAPDGQKHDRIFDSAYALGGLVHAGLNEQVIEDTLYAAILPRAKDKNGARQAILDGIAKGKERPRQVPERRDASPALSNGSHPAVKGTAATEYTSVPRAPIDVNDLLVMERKPVVWYAPSFLREGLGLLVGQPNVGKTPIAIQMAIAIATGGKWLNTVQCRQSKVLYLGMEYSPQELIPMFDISRMGQEIPRDCLLVKTIEDDFPTNAEAALDELEWYLRVMDVRVIIIDVLTAFLPPEKFKQNVYRGDYSELKPYHRLALQYNAAILGVWHASKRESDPKIMYNGSTGMWAAAASRITMYQDQEQRVRIAAFPRMGDRLDWALTQEKNNNGRRWVLADAAPEPMMSDTERIIWRWLRSNSDRANTRSVATIAEMTSLTPNTVKGTLRRMFDKNMIQQSRVGAGYYIDVTDVTDVTGVTGVTGVTNSTVPLSETRIDDSTTVELVTNVTEKSKNGYTGLAHQDASDPDRLQELQGFIDTTSIFDHIPAGDRLVFRAYLRSKQPKDQERAKELCQEYGIDYDQAKGEVQ